MYLQGSGFRRESFRNRTACERKKIRPAQLWVSRKQWALLKSATCLDTQRRQAFCEQVEACHGVAHRKAWGLQETRPATSSRSARCTVQVAARGLRSIWLNIDSQEHAARWKVGGMWEQAWGPQCLWRLRRCFPFSMLRHCPTLSQGRVSRRQQCPQQPVPGLPSGRRRQCHAMSIAP